MYIRKLLAIAFIPVDLVFHTLDNLKQHCPLELQSFLDTTFYLLIKQYIFPINYNSIHNSLFWVFAKRVGRSSTTSLKWVSLKHISLKWTIKRRCLGPGPMFCVKCVTSMGVADQF